MVPSIYFPFHFIVHGSTGDNIPPSTSKSNPTLKPLSITPENI